MLRTTTYLLLFTSTLLLTNCQNQEASATGENAEPANETTDFDPELAQKLGADEYGMKQYVIAFLKAGPNRDRSPEESKKLQKAHLDNITRMAEAGQLVIAGPFLDEGELRGIYVFNVTTVAEAEELTKTDPAIQAGSLVMELRPWYGSAALMEVYKWHTRIAKEKI